jgi:Immunity protein 53
MSALADIQKWYASNCDGEWEHEFGIKIDTMDNPGWSVSIDLDDTNLEGKEFRLIENHQSEESWIECRVKDNEFHGFGDPSKLEEILQIFIDWVKLQNEDWLNPPKPMSDEERQQYEDEQFFASLGDEVESEQCQNEKCRENRIRNSVMCRQHHFEMVKKRPVPYRAS